MPHPTFDNFTTYVDRFVSLAWYDKLIEFLFRFTAKTSEPLLAAGIVYSAADVLSHGQIGSGNMLLNNAWAITRAVAIESSGGVVLVYSLESIRGKDKVKAWLYFALSLLLSLAGGVMLFMQLAGWTEQKDSAFMLTLFALRCVVSIGYIYLCRTKNIRFSQIEADGKQIDPPTPISLEPEHTGGSKKATTSSETNENYLRVRDFLEGKPNAKVREVASALSISQPTASKWMRRVREKP
jgi:hypothetical protein